MPIAIQDNSDTNSFAIAKNQLIPLIQSPLIEPIPPIGSIFISGNTRQLFRLEKNNKEQYSIYLYDQSQSLCQDIKLDILPNRIYYDVESKKLFLQDTEGIISIVEDKKVKKIAAGQLVWRSNQLVLCTNKGIYNLSKNDEKLCNIDFPKLAPLWARSDKNGNILVAYHTSVAKIIELRLIKEDNSIMNYNGILATTENIKDVYADDFQEEVMLASYSGIYIIKMQNSGIKNYYVAKGKAKSEFGNVISAVTFASNKNNIYFIKETRGLMKIDASRELQIVNDGEAYTNNNSMCLDAQEENIYSTKYNFDGTGSLNVFNIKQKSHFKVNIPFTPLSCNTLQNGQIFISGNNKNPQFFRKSGKAAACIFDPLTKKITPVKFPEEMSAFQIRTITESKTKGHIWVGTSNGLFCLDAGYKIIHRFTQTSSEKSKRIDQAHIRQLKIYEDHLIAGTLNDGVYIIDINNHQIIRHFDRNKGLTDNSIIGIEKDQAENYWLASFNGITVINKEFKVLERIYDDEGLSNPEFNTGASCLDSEGRLYLGSINGITSLSTATTLKNRRKNQFVLEEITSFEKGSSKEISIQNDKITVPKSVDSIQFRYHIPSYFQHYYTQVQDQLEINYSGSKYRKDAFNITILEPKVGTHNLQLKTKGQAKLKSYKIEVQRNFIPFLAITGILLGIIAIWTFFTRLKIRNNRQLEEEKTKYNKKLAEMELTALRSQMNPHFIFNALGAIQYFINTQNVEKADDYLAKFAMLMRSILESSKSKYIQLDDELKLLRLYLSLEHIRFEEKFSYKFEVDDGIDLMQQRIPSMIIQPFIENAINHGLYNLKDKKGELLVRFEEIHEDHIVCTIQDNGIGREAAAKIRKLSKHKSRGMQIVDERIQALKI
ncbi:histidine kinase, partial [Saprospiraceae bacterium]|nr:histidine kinase [Saprospiraceae bacterium]